MPDDLPFIDQFDVAVEASDRAVFEALTRHLEDAFGSVTARVGAGLLGCVHRGASFAVPPVEGQVASGFVVSAVRSPNHLVLEGRHSFASYRLTFEIAPLAENRSQLIARTHALFPGLPGAAYRALVIGSGGHEILARRMLAAVAARAVRMEGGR